MFNKLITAAAITVASCGAPAYADETQCGTVESVAKFLAQRGERPLVTGVDISGNHVSIWLDLQTEEWSYVITDPDTKISCMVNYGSQMKPFIVIEGKPA